MADMENTKNILESPQASVIEKNDMVLVNDGNTLKQVTVEKLLSKENFPDEYITEDELLGHNYATTADVDKKLNKNQGSSNSGKYLSVGSNGDIVLVDAPAGGGESGGTQNYNELKNKPSIGGITLEGEKSLDDLGIQPKGNYLTNVPEGTSTSIGGYKAENATEDYTVPVKKKADGTLAVPTYPESGGGGSYTLPIMSGNTLGGGKAIEKTTETVPVAVDEEGQLFVPEYPESTGGSADIPRQEMQNTDTTVTLEPNKLYIFPEMASLTVTLATPSDINVANEYHFFFASGGTATTLTLNDVLSDAYSIEANMKYEVSILEGVAYIKGVAISAA